MAWTAQSHMPKSGLWNRSLISAVWLMRSDNIIPETDGLNHEYNVLYVWQVASASAMINDALCQHKLSEIREIIINQNRWLFTIELEV